MVLVRIALVAMPGLEPLGWRLAMILAVVTMTLGNVLALWQDNVRRLLAYSSIAHAGYMMVGLLAGAGGLLSVASMLGLVLKARAKTEEGGGRSPTTTPA